MSRLAEITHGFVGADLEALCREAAMICLRRILPDIDFGWREIPYEQLAKLEIQMDDFLGRPMRRRAFQHSRSVCRSSRRSLAGRRGACSDQESGSSKPSSGRCHYPALYRQGGDPASEGNPARRARQAAGRPCSPKRLPAKAR